MRYVCTQPTRGPQIEQLVIAGDVAALARERALRNPGLFSADGNVLLEETADDGFDFDGFDSDSGTLRWTPQVQRPPPHGDLIVRRTPQVPEASSWGP